MNFFFLINKAPWEDGGFVKKGDGAGNGSGTRVPPSSRLPGEKQRGRNFYNPFNGIMLLKRKGRTYARDSHPSVAPQSNVVSEFRGYWRVLSAGPKTRLREQQCERSFLCTSSRLTLFGAGLQFPRKRIKAATRRSPVGGDKNKISAAILLRNSALVPIPQACHEYLLLVL